MKINSSYNVGVFLTTTDTKKYSQWIPVVSSTWNMLGITPIIAGINYNIPYKENFVSLNYKNPTNVKNSSISQVIRIFYPGILKEYDAIIIADIDQIPLPNEYFNKYISDSITKNTFIGMRYIGHEYYMGWNVAPPNIWSELTGVYDINSLNNTLINLYAENSPTWNLDQKLLTKMLNTFNKKIKVENLDLYSIDILGDKMYKKGMFAHNKKLPAHNIKELNKIDKKQYIGAGTVTGKYFNESTLKKIINYFYDENIL